MNERRMTAITSGWKNKRACETSTVDQKLEKPMERMEEHSTICMQRAAHIEFMVMEATYYARFDPNAFCRIEIDCITLPSASPFWPMPVPLPPARHNQHRASYHICWRALG